MMRTESDRTTVFTEFVGRAEPRLRRALVASYGPAVGREAAVDALSWAWEHWDRLDGMQNPVGYLYRVGQTAAARVLTERPAIGLQAWTPDEPNVDADLAPYLARLSEQQRAAVVLVHGYAMSQRHVAEVLGITISTLREHLRRGMQRLRQDMEHER